MRTSISLLLLAAGVLGAPGLAQAQHRELGAHEHGRGALTIAIEALRVSAELEASGAAIVGFEHAPTTPEQKAALERAKARLFAPQDVLEFPAAAECMVQEARVAVESEAADEDHDQAGTQGRAEDEAHEHSGFHVRYAFNCKDTSRIRTIHFRYFEVFAGAERLDVTVVTAKGQAKFEVTRAKPRVDLAEGM